MMGLIRSKLKNFFPFRSDINLMAEEKDGNPLTAYYRFFNNQHKMITVLYKTLVFNFAAFLVLVTLFFFNVLKNPLMPSWGYYFLGFIDFFLAYGVYKAYKELGNYKKKNQQVLKGVEEKLGANLRQLNKIRSELGELEIISSKKKEYTGWDTSTCSHCGAKAEMLSIECPNCHSSLTPALPS